MNDNNSDFDLGLWLKWTAANAIGTPLGLALGYTLLWLTRDMGINSEGLLCGVGVLFGAGTGVIVGTMQWIAVGRRHYSAGRWVSASIVGSAIAWAIIFIGFFILLISKGLD